MKVASELRWEDGKEAERRAGWRLPAGRGGGAEGGSLSSGAASREMSAGPWYPGPSASRRAEMLISFPNGYRHCSGAVDPIKDSY